MKNRTILLVAAYLGLWVGLNAIAYAGLTQRFGPSNSLYLLADTASVIFGVAVSILLAVAIALAGRVSPWRLVPVAVLFWCGGSAGLAATPESARYFWCHNVVYLSLHTLGISFGMYLVRWMGIAVRRPPDRSSDGPPQFSLMSLLNWVAALAVVLGIVSATFRADDIRTYPVPAPEEMVLVVLMVSGVCAALGVLALWLALGRASAKWRLPLIGGLALVACCACILVSLPRINSRNEFYFALTASISGVLALSSVSLLVYRSAGVRLFWCPPWRRRIVGSKGISEAPSGDHLPGEAESPRPW